MNTMIKINNKITKVAFVLPLLFLAFACDNMLDVQPRTQVSSDNVLQTPDDISSAIISVYARLRAESNYGRNLMAVSDALADIGFATNNSGRLINENRNIPLNHFTHWQNSYFAINEINVALKSIEQLTFTPAPTQQTIDRWIGQLKFLRALYYHDLVKAYAYDPGTAAAVGSQDRGGIPLVLNGVKTLAADATTAAFPRATVAEVYTQLYADLNDAISRFNTSGSPSGAPFIAGGPAAQALLSRVALFNRDYATVVTAATAAITTSTVGNLQSGNAYVAAWRAAQHPESIFEVKFQAAIESLGVNVSMQSSFTSGLSLAALTSQGGWGDFAPLPSLIGAYGITPAPAIGTALTIPAGTIATATDVRAQLFAAGPGRGSGRKWECIKFIAKNGVPYLDNIPVFREAEMFLNRAEAYATPSSSVFNEALALADLNTIRTARGLAAVTLTGTALYNEILNQRRLEFAFEGHRWFDLKRLGLDVIKAGQFTGAVNVPFTDFRRLANIPQREVDGNPNLQQNFGY